jgi:hypothetical protein
MGVIYLRTASRKRGCEGYGDGGGSGEEDEGKNFNAN